MASSPSLPQSLLSWQNASMAPGTVTASGVCRGTVTCPFSRSISAVRPAGALPDPFIALMSSLPAGEKRTKQSPPIPVICGSQIPKSTAPAIAASIALPPRSRMLTAVFAAKGCDVAQSPLVEKTGDRPGKWKSRINSPPFHAKIVSFYGLATLIILRVQARSAGL